MRRTIRLLGLPLASAVVWLATAVPMGADDDKPRLQLKASPLVSFSPADIRLMAEIKGGPDDYESFYCPVIEWDWGDDTRSQLRADCDPYEAGTSEITRRYRTTHTYRMSGQYRIVFRLKRQDEVIASASTTIQVRPGLRDAGGPWP